jgi:hypothetical protein
MAIINTTVEQTSFLVAIDRFSNIAQLKRFVSRSRQKNRGRERNLCKINKAFIERGSSFQRGRETGFAFAARLFGCN